MLCQFGMEGYFSFMWYWLFTICLSLSFCLFYLTLQEKNKDKDKRFRPLYDIPYMFEAREFLRKKLIGKKVRESDILPYYSFCISFFFHVSFCILSGVTKQVHQTDLELIDFIHRTTNDLYLRKTEWQSTGHWHFVNCWCIYTQICAH